MKQVISSIVAGFVCSAFVYLFLETVAVKDIINSNPGVWELMRVRSTEVIGMIGGFALGISSTWNIIENCKRTIE